jgi:hypothetical protein
MAAVLMMNLLWTSTGVAFGHHGKARPMTPIDRA